MGRRRTVAVVVAALAVAALAGCVAPMGAPGRTNTISLVSTQTSDGWRYDYYRNTAYPCAVSGFQTFTIATKVGSSATVARPLWVYMHGGGVGWFSPDGSPQPGTGQKTEESAATQVGQFRGPLMARVRTDAAEFRMLTVSMCDHDIYGGHDLADPNNPNTTPDGKARTVNGLYATKAAIAFTTAAYPTDDYFLHGTSAGSFGTFHVAWALEQQGIPPAGSVADSGVLNIPWQLAQADNPVCGRSDEAHSVIPRRLHPEIVKVENQPANLVADGRLTVPILDVFSIGDRGQCGTQPMDCPLPDGSTVRMGSVDCMHAPLTAAIAAQGPTSKSRTARLCISPADAPGSCATHTSTVKAGLVNTGPDWPADYISPMVDWVHDRLADD